MGNFFSGIELQIGKVKKDEWYNKEQLKSLRHFSSAFIHYIVCF